MKRAILVLICFLLFTANHVSAIEPVDMSSFTVKSIDGSVIRSEEFLINARWVLLYLMRDCSYCDGILQTLELFQDPLISKRLIILVGGGDAEAMRMLIGPREKIASLGWYIDPDWAAYETLPISATPVAFGIENGIIRWSFAGTPWNKQTVQSILGSWINY
jgi:hypothetical protein